MKRLILLVVICFMSLMGSARADQADHADHADHADLSPGLEKVVLQLKWQHQFQFAGYYAALEQGYYRAAGLDVELRERGPGQPRSVELLLAGEASYAIEGSNALVRRLQGKPLVALAAIFQHSPSVAIALQKDQINTAKGMIGKRLMAFGASEVELPAMLIEEGVDPQEIFWLPTSFNINSLTTGATDLYSAYLTNEPFYLEQQKIAYSVINPVNYGIDFYGDILLTSEQEIIDHPRRVRAFRDASLKGWRYALAHPAEMVDLILNQYSPKKTREHLLYEARESIKLIEPDVVTIGHINPGRFTHMAEVLKRLGQVDQLDDLDGFVYRERSTAQLTDKELTWLSNNKKVRVLSGHAPPLMFDDGLNPPQGLLVDYLHRLTEEFGVSFEYIRMPWAKAIGTLGSEAGPDLIAALRPTAERREQFALSQPYLNLPWVIFSREESGSIGGVEDLVGRKVSLPAGFVLEALLGDNYPQIQLVRTETAQQALSLLSTGLVDAYVGDLLLTSYMAKEIGLENIKVAAPFPLQNPEHVMAFRNDWPELASLFNLVLSRLSPQEHAAIRHKWLSMRFEYGTSREDLWRWGGSILVGLLLAGGIFTLWTRRLQKEIKRRKQTEDALVSSVQQYQHLVQVIPHGIIELNPELLMTYCNQPLAEMLGYELAELRGKAFVDLLAGEKTLPALFEQWLQTAKYPNIQLQLLDKLQRPRDVQLDLNTGEAVAGDNQIIIVTDLTRQQQAETALQKSETFYRNTFENIQVGVLHLTTEGLIFRVNPFMREMLGYSELELLTLDLFHLTYEEDISLSRDLLQQLQTAGSGSYSLAKRYMKRNGDPVWVLVTVALQPQMSGETGYVVVVQNIDDFKQQQDLVTAKAQNLEEIIAQRTAELQARVIEVEALNSAMVNLADDLSVTNALLEVKRQEVNASNRELEAFAYSVSHDLRAPLRHAAGFATVLREHAAGVLDETSHQHLDKIISAAEKMGQMIDDLLSFSRVGRAELMITSIDMNLLFGEVRNEISERFKPLVIDWQIAKLPRVHGDLSALRQVVINLLDNAAKYSSKTAQPRIEVSSSHDGDEFTFTVRDNGVGFDSTYADKLFQVFQRLHQEKDFSGTGIGLASVRRIVERHGGWVVGESNTGQGACFRFGLPDNGGGKR